LQHGTASQLDQLLLVHVEYGRVLLRQRLQVRRPKRVRLVELADEVKDQHQVRHVGEDDVLHEVRCNATGLAIVVGTGQGGAEDRPSLVSAIAVSLVMKSLRGISSTTSFSLKPVAANSPNSLSATFLMSNLSIGMPFCRDQSLKAAQLAS